MQFKIRPMIERDLEITLKWRNDPEIRKQAQTDDIISIQEHTAMFKFNNAVKLVFDINHIPAGYISVTRDPDSATGEWSFHMGSEHRGEGLSIIMLEAALYYLKKREGYIRILSKVKKTNSISKHLHSKLGFIHMEDIGSDFFEYYLDLY